MSIGFCGGWSLRFTLFAATLIVLVGLCPSARAADPRELRARQAYAAGEYDQALELFAELYAETLHPTYLRNIGRCHQLQGNPDRAITSFKEYLRKGKDISADEQKEIEGFIDEMRALQAEQQTQQDGVAPPPAVAPPEPEPDVAIVNEPAPVKDDDGGLLGQWWFWTGVGAVVAGAVVTGVLLSGGEDALSCPAGRMCR